MAITADILDRVAEENECDPLDLPPLYHSIDADALERCVTSAESPVTFQFTYYSYTVTVRGDDEVKIEIDARDDARDVDPVR